jgi:hypothetical protein
MLDIVPDTVTFWPSYEDGFERICDGVRTAARSAAGAAAAKMFTMYLAFQYGLRKGLRRKRRFREV